MIAGGKSTIKAEQEDIYTFSKFDILEILHIFFYFYLQLLSIVYCAKD